jgi:hypothetical protein
MSWELYSKGKLFSRIFVHKKKDIPACLTPVYIASFSSFGDNDFNEKAIATLRSIRLTLPDADRPPVLVSAYDLKRRLRIGETGSTNANPPELLIELTETGTWYLDSGVYEKDCLQDDSWELADYLSVLRATKPPCVVTYDFRPKCPSIPAFAEAIQRTASSLNREFTESQLTLLVRFHATAGLWETERDNAEVNRIEQLLGVLTKVLSESDGIVCAVGVVENELGPGVRSRLRSLARLRAALDSAGIEKPIHVFGASDPQALALYCLAGADIFDGVNWSRYYLDTEDCCLRDKGLLSWKEPHLGEAASLTGQSEMLSVNNILRMQQFTSNLRRLIETGQPVSNREECWHGFVMDCCGDILERSE